MEKFGIIDRRVYMGMNKGKQGENDTELDERIKTRQGRTTDL
ncbi:MAG: hypothetical protein CM15mV25_1050 [uncultured marine virus]|nr:MAG: hypothetical protein CM15mV25_1050 [uncultured marine virus]